MSKAFLLLVLLAALLGLVSCRLASHPADSSSVLMRVNDVLMKELNVLDGETHDVQHQQRFSGLLAGEKKVISILQDSAFSSGGCTPVGAMTKAGGKPGGDFATTGIKGLTQCKSDLAEDCFGRIQQFTTMQIQQKKNVQSPEFDTQLPGNKNNMAGMRGSCCMYGDLPNTQTPGNVCYKCGDGICSESTVNDPSADGGKRPKYQCGKRVKDSKDDKCVGKSVGERCHPELQTCDKVKVVVGQAKGTKGSFTCEGSGILAEGHDDIYACGEAAGDPTAENIAVCVKEESPCDHEKCCNGKKGFNSECKGETGKERCVESQSMMGSLGAGGSKTTPEEIDAIKTPDGEDDKRRFK